MVKTGSEISWNYYYATTKLLLYYLRRRNNSSTVTWAGKCHTCTKLRANLEPLKDSTTALLLLLSPSNNLSQATADAFQNRSI